MDHADDVDDANDMLDSIHGWFSKQNIVMG
jgi:hypothetical protein